jgi:hypothetical protein
MTSEEKSSALQVPSKKVRASLSPMLPQKPGFSDRTCEPQAAGRFKFDKSHGAKAQVLSMVRGHSAKPPPLEIASRGDQPGSSSFDRESAVKGREWKTMGINIQVQDF